MTPETITLETPAGPDWAAVVRLVLGGIGDRLDLGFEELDDLQLAVERLMAEAGTGEQARVAIELTRGGVRAHVGPIAEGSIAGALQGAEPPPGELTLRRVLETVVDSFGVEGSGAGGLYVRVEKLVHRAS